MIKFFKIFSILLSLASLISGYYFYEYYGTPEILGAFTVFCIGSSGVEFFTWMENKKRLLELRKTIANLKLSETEKGMAISVLLNEKDKIKVDRDELKNTNAELYSKISEAINSRDVFLGQIKEKDTAIIKLNNEISSLQGEIQIKQALIDGFEKAAKGKRLCETKKKSKNKKV